MKKGQVLGEFKIWQLVIKSWDTERGRAMIQQRVAVMKERHRRYCGNGKKNDFVAMGKK